MLDDLMGYFGSFFSTPQSITPSPTSNPCPPQLEWDSPIVMAFGAALVYTAGLATYLACRRTKPHHIVFHSKPMQLHIASEAPDGKMIRLGPYEGHLESSGSSFDGDQMIPAKIKKNN